METIRAIQLSHLEQELIEVTAQIKKYTFILNSPNFSKSGYQDLVKKIERLIVKQKIIETKITESVLLG